MNFELTEDQIEIKSVAREMLAARFSPERARDAAECGQYDPDLWHAIVDLGWPGIAVSDDFGGVGLGCIEASILAEELGAALAGSPFLSTVIAAAFVASAGDDEMREKWLPRLADGTARAGFGVGRIGQKSIIVADGSGADLIVLVLDDHVYAVEGDVSARAIEMIDPTRSFIRLDSVPAGALELSGAATEGMAWASALWAADLLGICQRTLDMTVDYAKNREQFGQPIGSFQAVAHRCTDMLLATESARSTVRYAAWAIDNSPDDGIRACTLAKSVASKSARDVTASGIQVHGGIGFTWESDLHWLFKRARTGATFLGSPSQLHPQLLTLDYSLHFGHEYVGADQDAGHLRQGAMQR